MLSNELEFFRVIRMNSDNRRQFLRVDFGGHVCLNFTYDRYDRCQVKDLSLAGLSVLGNFRNLQLKNCQIKLFNETNNETINMQATGKVVWCNEAGVGLKYTEMTFNNYVLLLKTLMKNVEQPSIILHEFSKRSPFLLK